MGRLKTLTALLLGVCCLVLSGCVYRNEAVPAIVPEAAGADTQVLLPPRHPVSERTPGHGANSLADIPPDWLPPARVEKQWSAIVIHHSATENGNMAIFDRAHREENQWDGVGYDFVIGNGTDSADGQVEVTFRWHGQIAGAHCKTPGNWANEHAVGICLVGNFDYQRPSRRQMASLAQLVHFLQTRYQIPTAQIHGHKTMPGARSTDCPGAHFSMSDFHALVDQQF